MNSVDIETTIYDLGDQLSNWNKILIDILKNVINKEIELRKESARNIYLL